MDRLGGLPAEYKADIGFSILERSGTRLQIARQQEIFNEIFKSAPSARYPTFARFAASSGDSIANVEIETLFSQRYDTLDIQLQVVKLAQSNMPSFAARKFGEISLRSVRSTCAEPSVANLDDYYTTALHLSNDQHVDVMANTPKRLFFLEMIRDAKDPERFFPSLAFLTKASWTELEWQQVIGVLVHNLGDMQASDREMVGLQAVMQSSVSQLLNRLVAADQPVVPFMEAYRSFLVRSLTGSSCRDKTADRIRVAKAFNALFDGKLDSVTSQVRHLSVEEIRPSSKGISATDPLYTVDETLGPYVQRLAEYKRARLLAKAGKAGPPDAVDTTEDVTAILNSTLAPKAYGSQCSLCDFAGRMFGFVTLTDNLPPGRDFQKSVAAEIDFLSFNRIEDEYPPAFMDSLKLLINVARPIDPKSQPDLVKALTVFRNVISAPNEDPETIRNDLHRSQDRIIRTYMAYEDLFRPAYELSPEVAARVAKSIDVTKPNVPAKAK
ncbi:MAG: hypothetical protein ABI147_14550 [Acidobacteriaceae bacterium]